MNTISKALLSIGAHDSGVSVSEITVGNDAINELFFQQIIEQTKAKFPHDLQAFIDNVALASFRCGMLYERVRNPKAPARGESPDAQ